MKYTEKQETNMHSLQERYKDEIAELVAASRRLGEMGFVASHGGNLSYKLSDEHILITPTKVVKRKMEFEDIVIISPSGDILSNENGRNPTGETPMHTLIFQKRANINAIIHAHPPILTGFAISGNNILSRPLLPEPTIEIGPILISDYAEPISKNLAMQLNKIIPYSNAWLMRNHGITIGSTDGIIRALDLLEMAEALAISVNVALQSGGINEISREEVEKLENTIKTRNMNLPGDPNIIIRLTDLYY
jgi:L-fuculose-phosphate aldolase